MICCCCCCCRRQSGLRPPPDLRCLLTRGPSRAALSSFFWASWNPSGWHLREGENRKCINLGGVGVDVGAYRSSSSLALDEAESVGDTSGESSHCRRLSRVCPSGMSKPSMSPAASESGRRALRPQQRKTSDRHQAVTSDICSICLEEHLHWR